MRLDHYKVNYDGVDYHKIYLNNEQTSIDCTEDTLFK